MKLHRGLGVTQHMEWLILHRLREAWEDERPDSCSCGLVEVDEDYIGSEEQNRPHSRYLNSGCGPVGRAPFIGVKNRDSSLVNAKAVESVSQGEVGQRYHEIVERGPRDTDTLGPCRSAS